MCLKQLEYLFYLMKYTVNYFSWSYIVDSLAYWIHYFHACVNRMIYANWEWLMLNLPREKEQEHVASVETGWYFKAIS